MFYAFVKKNLEESNKDSDFILQADYAKQIQKFILVDTERHGIYDHENNMVMLEGEKVFLRAGYWTLKAAIQTISQFGGEVQENLNQIALIEHWPRFIKTKRKIWILTKEQLVTQAFEDDLIRLMEYNVNLFIKPIRKSYHAIVGGESFLNYHSAVLKSIREDDDQEYLISEEIEILEDEIGPIEVRVIVFDGEVQTLSREVHSVYHCVDSVFRKTAEKIAKLLKQVSEFPRNYVLDLGLMKKNNVEMIDVIELNPMTTSQMYVNNSIFNDKKICLDEKTHFYGFGTEFAFDFQRNRKAYELELKPLNMKDFLYYREDRVYFED